MNIVLHQPEIPANTGNIGRTCVATGTRLHLIEPLGFRLSEKEIRRAGMDYWEHLDVTRYVNYNTFLEQNPGGRIWYATTKAKRIYNQVQFEADDYIMCRHPRRNTGGERSAVYPHSHAGRNSFIKFIQFCGNCTV